MQVKNILDVKNELNAQKNAARNALYTVKPDETLINAVNIMAENDIGSIVVWENKELKGIVTFKEIIHILNEKKGVLDHALVRTVMNKEPLTCTPETELNVVRRMMLEKHTRYLIVLDKSDLLGVISFYDVAHAIVREQDFENKALKAYIRDWPEEEEQSK